MSELNEKKGFWQHIALKLVLWVGFFIFHFVENVEFISTTQSFVRAATYTLLVAGAVYINEKWLIERFFFQKKIVVYLISLAIVIALASIIYEYATLGVPSLFSEGEVIGLSWYSFSYTYIQLLLLVTSISSVLIAFQQLNTKEKLVRVEKEKVHSQLNYLRSQTNPHFLFNVLNNIHFLIRRDQDKASDTLLKLSDLLRYQLYETDVEFVPLEKEIEHIQNYIELEKMRIGDTLLFKELFDVQATGLKVPPFLLLPPVENAFKHSEHADNRQITFELSATENTLLFKTKNTLGTVNNTGVGGLGLQNLRYRLELIYPEKHQFETEQTETHYLTILKINL